MAIRVFGVEGEMLPGHEGATTQDFVRATGKVFIDRTLTSFLADFRLNATVAPRLPEAAKEVVSRVAQATNAAFNALAIDAPKVDIYGHPKYHPMGEAYYSQIALRHGAYVAKLAVVPANPALEALFDKGFAMEHASALRTATTEYFRAHPAEFDVKIQLATDRGRMPVEDPTVEWPESESPYRTVARLRLPVQDAFSVRVQIVVDRQLSFSPGHALAAHRPLGRFGRTRVAVTPSWRGAGARRTDSRRPKPPRSPR